MIRFFCFVYGEHFLDLLESVAVRSLCQSRNRQSIPFDAVVALYSDAPTIDRASLVLEKLGQVESHIVDLSGDTADIQNRAFAEEISRCHASNATMIVLGPENYWGDGSLGNILAIAGTQNVCVSAPHVRVDRNKFLAAMPDGDMNNRALVNLSMRTLHPSWVNADANKEQTSSYYAGISIREISAGLYSVTHRLPTCWLARFTKEDVAFFQRNTQGRGLWDHAWPQMLIQSGRHRVIGSSDAVFIAELTDTNTHNVPLMPNNPSEPDAYCQPSLHAQVNRNTVAIWRS